MQRSHDAGKRATLQLAHSPDPDDAFMWWPLFSIEGRPPAIDTGRFRFEPVTADIQTLNDRSASGEYEITAISCAQYPYVAARYALTMCGASMGEQYGPKLVAARSMTVDELKSGGATIAIPGRRTSAYAAARMMLNDDFPCEVVEFDEIIDRVLSGEFKAGLVIHEGQLTFERAGLHLVADLGAWWWQAHQLPLPLGVNAIRRDLNEDYGEGTLDEVTCLLLRSVEHALANRQESIAYAMQYARDTPPDLADEFVRMYVNKWTLDFGPVGRRAVGVFLSEAARHGLLPEVGEVSFVSVDAVRGSA